MTENTENTKKKSKVALVACEDYDQERVQDGVTRCLELLGGVKAMVKPGGHVLIKPNLLIPIAPKRAVTTHPEVVRALIRAVQEVTDKISVGDCPMFAKPESALRRCGLLEVINERGVRSANMAESVVIQGPEGRRFKRFEIVKEASEADLLINAFKLKTHGLSGLTLAIKNIFGVVPGLEKSKWHLKAQDHIEMNSMLVDLFEAVRSHREFTSTVLHLCDGVVGLEGEGPGPAGTPRKVGVIAASTDAVALDAVLSRLVGFDVEEVLTTPIAAERGLGVAELDRIEIVGESLGDLSLSGAGFTRNRGSLASGEAFTKWPFTHTFFRDRMVERPKIVADRCTGCGECRKVCAAKAITLGGEPKKAQIDTTLCIRCYCCIEVCQYEAARLGMRPVMARIADRMDMIPWMAAGLGLLTVGALVYYWMN